MIVMTCRNLCVYAAKNSAVVRTTNRGMDDWSRRICHGRKRYGKDTRTFLVRVNNRCTGYCFGKMRARFWCVYTIDVQVIVLHARFTFFMKNSKGVIDVKYRLILLHFILICFCLTQVRSCSVLLSASIALQIRISHDESAERMAT